MPATPFRPRRLSRFGPPLAPCESAKQNLPCKQDPLHSFNSIKMEKYNTRRPLGSYSIDLSLIRSLEDFIATRIPRILNFGRGAHNLSGYGALILTGSNESTIYTPLFSYTQEQFHNDIQTMAIELVYKEEGGSSTACAIGLLLRLGKSREDCELSLAVQDNNPQEKARLIEEGLLAILDKHKNGNSRVYPNEFMPTLLFIVGFLIGMGGLAFPYPLLRILCVGLFGITVYVVARRFINGYCRFDSRRQRQLDRLLTGLTLLLILSFAGYAISQFLIP
jgi:hypothetical protein